MPSRFPGMDPFIEIQCWRDFHTTVIGEIRSALLPQLRPHYVAFVEEDVYVARDDGEPIRLTVPDLGISRVSDWPFPVQDEATLMAEPTMVTLPVVEPIEIPYIVIRRRDNDETVAVIEVLSPTNKSLRDGRTEYLAKRNMLLRSRVHLIEIDLLRSGERMPTNEPYPPGDYFAIVSRSQARPSAALYSWALEQRMPRIPIPLADGDPDALLDLQHVFSTTYDRAGYDYALKYDRAVIPELNAAHREWVRQTLHPVE